MQNRRIKHSLQSGTKLTIYPSIPVNDCVFIFSKYENLCEEQETKFNLLINK